MALEKGRGPSGEKFSRMASLGKVLKYHGIQRKKNTGIKEQTRTIDTDGNLKAAHDFGGIASDLNSLKLGKTPYFPNVSKSEK